MAAKATERRASLSHPLLLARTVSHTPSAAMRADLVEREPEDLVGARHQGMPIPLREFPSRGSRPVRSTAELDCLRRNAPRLQGLCIRRLGKLRWSPAGEGGLTSVTPAPGTAQAARGRCQRTQPRLVPVARLQVGM